MHWQRPLSSEPSSRPLDPTRTASMTVEKQIAELQDRSDVLIFDTETTGFARWDEIVEIAIVNARGDVLLDTLVKAKSKITPGATAIHGLTQDRLESVNAPAWNLVWPEVQSILARASALLAWGIQFDLRLLSQTNTAWGVSFDGGFRMPAMGCLMQAHPLDTGTGRTMSLRAAYEQLRGKPFDGAHTALTDALATVEVFRSMSGVIEVQREAVFAIDGGNGAWHGKGIAITGVPPDMSKSSAERMIRGLGASVTRNVTKKKTDLLIVCDNPGKTKLSAAKKWGTPTLTWNQFKGKLRQAVLYSHPDVERPCVMPQNRSCPASVARRSHLVPRAKPTPVPPAEPR